MIFDGIKYSYPYLLLLLFLTILMMAEFHCIKTGKGVKLVRQIAIVSFILFFGLRFYVGYDVIQYKNFYDQLPTLFQPKSNSQYRFEIGWYLYNVLCKSLSLSFEAFIFFNTLIDALFLDNLLKRYTKHYILGLIIFIGYYGVVLEVEQLRNAKSIFLFLYSLRYIEEKKPLKYFVINLIGLSMHISAFIYLFLYHAIKRRHTKRFYAIVGLFCLSIFVFRIQWIKPISNFLLILTSGAIHEKIATYINVIILGGPLRLSFKAFECIFSYILFTILTFDKLEQKSKNNIMFVNIFMFYAICYSLLYEIEVVALRLSALFIFAYPILYSNVIDVINTKLYKQLIVCIIVLCSLRLTHVNIKTELYKYDSVLFCQQTSKSKIQKSIQLVNDDYTKKTKEKQQKEKHSK